MLDPNRSVSARPFAFLAVAVLPLALFALSYAQPEAYDLPGESVFPEGIAVDEDAGAFYVGASAGGAIFRADIASGEVTTISDGDLPMALGMTVDPYGRLWVAGGASGRVAAYDVADGSLIGTWPVPENGDKFVNDLTFLDDAVYLTDSFQPVLYRIDAGPDEIGEPQVHLEFAGSPLQYVEGFNANGIVPTPDGEALIVVQSATGQLYRIGLDEQSVSVVSSNQVPVFAGDGLVLIDHVLWVVQNEFEQIVPLRLTPEGFEARGDGPPLRSDAFAFPTTAAAYDGSLFVVNSQFDRQGGEPELPFRVVRMALP
ncbi:MAG: SMP-30/gluconolactonase/LRE family protein [Trueperaceae bacterium]